MSAKQLNPNAIGENIRRCRKQKGLTQDALAQEMNVTAQAISKWENGQSMPDIALLLPLAKVLGIGVDELLGGNRRQQLEKKFQAALGFGEEHTLLVSLEALEEFRTIRPSSIAARVTSWLLTNATWSLLCRGED